MHLLEAAMRAIVINDSVGGRHAGDRGYGSRLFIFNFEVFELLCATRTL